MPVIDIMVPFKSVVKLPTGALVKHYHHLIT
jgi:hypothetical protein